MDTSQLCRSCMKEVASWERENFDQRIIYMFSYCTNIQITENDLLPKQFCYDCTIKIESLFTYVKEAQRSNEYLTNLLTERTIIVDTTKCTKPTLDHNEDPTFEEIEDKFIDEIATNDPIEDTALNETVDTQPVTENVIKTPIKETKTKTISDQKLVCTICKKMFLSKVWFEKHMRNQHNGDVFVYKCSQCPKTFQRPSQLSVHAVTHSAERRYACSCGKRYKRRKELAVHARTHSAARPYQCDHCSMRYRYKRCKLTVLARAHSAARPYQCDHCSMSFKLRSVLKGHLQLHQPDKPHLCYVCGCSFRQAGNLAVHMRTHTGAKPHSCACGYNAASASSLRRHQARHRAPRAHPCRACAKAFPDKAALTRHERSHTGARPYRCPAAGCARSFADSWKRKLHLMRAHRVPLARIPRMRADPAAPSH